jgi:hypothetical protein
MVRIQVIERICLPEQILYNLCSVNYQPGISVSIPELYYSGVADRFIRGIPRAEDRVDEHCSVEGVAQAAEAGGITVDDLFADRDGARVANCYPAA